MPKIVKNDEEIRLIYLKNNIRKRMEAKSITPKQMAIYSHMGESTFMKKKEHPEYFTMPELLRV
ncbi:toxin HipA, partial [Frisingicoccus sp.]|uniref:toxin HipA n=1 Tax=Frisingicoccus sp. TaxID=1918627 RepID=UPI002E783883